MAMLLFGCPQNEADAYRKIRLRAEDVQGRNVLTNFWVSLPVLARDRQAGN